MDVKFFVNGTVEIPTIANWIISLSSLGLDCEFTPFFEPAKENGFLNAKVIVKPGIIPKFESLSGSPLLVGFNYNALNYRWHDQYELDRLNKFPYEIRTKILNTKRIFSFSIEYGQSLVDLMVLFYSAATFAMLSNGIFQGENIRTHEAVSLTGSDSIPFVINEMNCILNSRNIKADFQKKCTQFDNWDKIISNREKNLFPWIPEEYYIESNQIPF